MRTDRLDAFDQILLKGHAASYQLALETAVRTGTALIVNRGGKIVRVKPPYKYVLVPIRKKRSKR